MSARTLIKLMRLVRGGAASQITRRAALLLWLTFPLLCIGPLLQEWIIAFITVNYIQAWVGLLGVLADPLRLLLYPATVSIAATLALLQFGGPTRSRYKTFLCFFTPMAVADAALNIIGANWTSSQWRWSFAQSLALNIGFDTVGAVILAVILIYLPEIVARIRDKDPTALPPSFSQVTLVHAMVFGMLAAAVFITSWPIKADMNLVAEDPLDTTAWIPSFPPENQPQLALTLDDPSFDIWAAPTDGAFRIGVPFTSSARVAAFKMDPNWGDFNQRQISLTNRISEIETTRRPIAEFEHVYPEIAVPIEGVAKDRDISTAMSVAFLPWKSSRKNKASVWLMLLNGGQLRLQNNGYGGVSMFFTGNPTNAPHVLFDAMQSQFTLEDLLDRADRKTAANTLQKQTVIAKIVSCASAPDGCPGVERAISTLQSPEEQQADANGNLVFKEGYDLYTFTPDTVAQRIVATKASNERFLLSFGSEPGNGSDHNCCVNVAVYSVRCLQCRVTGGWLPVDAVTTRAGAGMKLRINTNKTELGPEDQITVVGRGYIRMMRGGTMILTTEHGYALVNGLPLSSTIWLETPSEAKISALVFLLTAIGFNKQRFGRLVVRLYRPRQPSPSSER